MSDDTLPPLPHEGLLSWQTTADEMRAYGQACADAAIERCALVCDERANHEALNNRASEKWAAEDCAAAIRALKGKPA
jgi:hypothetical protein